MPCTASRCAIYGWVKLAAPEPAARFAGLPSSETGIAKMQNQPWDKLASAIELARLNGDNSFCWPSVFDPRLCVSVEWNGGLPIISVESAGVFLSDLTAFDVLRMLEGVSP